MKQISIFFLLITTIMLFTIVQLRATDIFRMIDPQSPGNSKSPDDGPPFLRFDNAQQYYHTLAIPSSYLNDISTSFEKWNNEGSVQFSYITDIFSGVRITVFWENNGYNEEPYIVNPGKTNSHWDGNYNIVTNFSTAPTAIAINTWHAWGEEQDLQLQMLDVQTILVHELGHLYGLDHPLTNSYTHDASAPVMAGADNEYFWDHTARELRADDINGTRFLQYNRWVPDQCTTIQSALSSSYSGGTIHIDAGTYNENLNIGNTNNLTLIGEGSANTIINGNITAFFCNNLKINSLRFNNITAYYCNLGDFYCNINGGGIALYSCSGFDQAGTISNSSTGLTAAVSSGEIFPSSLFSSNSTSIYCYGSGNVLVNGSRLCTSINYDFKATNYGHITSWLSYFQNGNPRTYQSSGGTISINYPFICGMAKACGTEDIQDSLLLYAELQSDDAIDVEFEEINDSYFNLLRMMKEGKNGSGQSDNGELNNNLYAIVKDFKNFIKKNPQSSLAHVALTTAANSYRLHENYNIMKSFLDEILNDKELVSLKGTAENLMIDYYICSKDFDNAINRADAVIENYKSDKELSCDALFKKGLLFSYMTNQPEKAAECFLKILENSPENSLTEFAKNELSVLGYNRDQIEEEDAVITEQDAFNLNSYPNPFNPTTTIQYALPQDIHVKIEVFNTQGQRIKTLIDNLQTSGTHQVTFDGTNLASGIYYYRFSAGNFSTVKRILLLK